MSLEEAVANVLYEVHHLREQVKFLTAENQRLRNVIHGAGLKEGLVQQKEKHAKDEN